MLAIKTGGSLPLVSRVCLYVDIESVSQEINEDMSLKFLLNSEINKDGLLAIKWN